METEKNFDKINSFIKELNKSFDKETLSRKHELDWLNNEISSKVQSSREVLIKSDSLNSNIVVLESKILDIEDKITKKNITLSEIKVKKDELNQLEVSRDNLLANINDINSKLTLINSKFVADTEKFEQLKNNITKLLTQKDNFISIVAGLEGEKKSTEDAIKNTGDILNTINNDIVLKKSDMESICDKINDKNKKLEILSNEFNELEVKKSILDTEIDTCEKKLNAILIKSRETAENTVIEKNKLKHEEDRLHSLRKEIEATILNNREQIDKNKLAEFIKSIDDGRNKISR